MPHFPRPAIVIVLATLAAQPLAAQGQPSQLGSPQMKPGPFRPGPLPRPVTPPPPRPQAEIMLRDLPDDMLRIAQDPDWPDTQRNPGILGVTRRGKKFGLCRPPSDSIDLRRIRANGFRVVGYSLRDGFGPSGYTVAGHSNVRPYKYISPNSDRLENAHNPAEIERINVTPIVWVLDIYVGSSRQRMACASTWGLEIRVIGPKGINPYTGRPQ